MANQQLHRRFSDEQFITILENYLAGELKAGEAMDALDLKKSQFFNLVSQYKSNSNGFTIKHKGNNGNRRISNDKEQNILKELVQDKQLIDNQDMPIHNYNYSAIKDNLERKYGFKVSLPTIINRAKDNGYYLEKKIKKIHDREVVTNNVGELIQHDSSFHQWSPYMDNKLYLITSLDDHSRLLLFADLFEFESSWNHILALKSVFLQYGCPLKYYPDQHSIFKYVKDRDKNRPFNVYTKFTGDVITQWSYVLKECNVNLTCALSPQAKGKIERPYRWLQDRIVRTAARDNLKTLTDLRLVLKDLVYQYNNKWIHSTTKEIPIERFEKSIQDKKSLFRKFKINNPKQTVDDIFCLKEQRMVDAYRKISLMGVEMKVPKGIPRQTVLLNMTPVEKDEIVKIRFWQKNTFLGEQTRRLDNLPIVRF